MNQQINQIGLFDNVGEKGSSEWNLGTVVREDKQPGMFRVASPQRSDTPRYTNVVKIRRYHQETHLFPRGA